MSAFAHIRFLSILAFLPLLLSASFHSCAAEAQDHQRALREGIFDPMVSTGPPENHHVLICAQKVWGCNTGAFAYTVTSHTGDAQMMSFGHLGQIRFDRTEPFSHEAQVLCVFESGQPDAAAGDATIRSVVALCNPARNSCFEWFKADDECGQSDHIQGNEQAWLHIHSGEIGNGQPLEASFRAKASGRFLNNPGGGDCKVNSGEPVAFTLTPFDHNAWPKNRDEFVVTSDGEGGYSMGLEERQAKLYGGRCVNGELVEAHPEL